MMLRRLFLPPWALARLGRRTVRRAAFTLVLASVLGLAATLLVARERTEQREARLETAAEQLDSLTSAGPEDDVRRAAIAWGYAERLRLGLESPFRLIESASRDTRLTDGERRTVAWALLAHVIRGESHQVDPAALDFIGPSLNGRAATGEQHLALIGDVVTRADDPRAGELAVRFAYALAATERFIDASAPGIVAEAAALLADREIARREGIAIVRTVRSRDPIEEIARRRATRGMYVERPVLLAPEPSIEREAIALTAGILDELRALRPEAATLADTADGDPGLGDDLRVAARDMPPASPLVVTLQRFAPLIQSRLPAAEATEILGVTNPEMLVGALPNDASDRVHRRVIGRLLMSTAVAMRSHGQEPVFFAGDSVMTPAQVATAIGASAVAFDAVVPDAWRPYLLRSLTLAVRDLRRVLPSLDLTKVQVRFRMTPPADSALAMHDPRTRTLHLPATTAGGTLLHELAHELDRQSAVQAGLAGYRSDAETRAIAGRKATSNNRVATSLRALTEENSTPFRLSKAPDRPAEIFATRVDWFVAQALARDGISNGFLTGVQDELLTGHVVHPQRLRHSGRSLSLLDALEGMTPVAPRARRVDAVSASTLLRWSLEGPLDRSIASRIAQDDEALMDVEPLPGSSEASCVDEGSRVALVRLAAESRARGWLRQRARWMSPETRPAWAHALLGQGPWSTETLRPRIESLRAYVLLQLASPVELPAGLDAYAAEIASQAGC